MPDPALLLIEIIGEGKTDRGSAAAGSTEGVLPSLVHRLCDTPLSMQFVRRPLHTLQKGGLDRKARFAKQQAYYNRSAAVVFVVDTEGDHPGQINLLKQGRDGVLPNYPMVVGVAHPCIESWLLADPKAIRRGLALPAEPTVPDMPESLPAPCKDRENNPKTVLGACSSAAKGQLSSREMGQIAREINNLDLIRARCPIGFEPFAEEVVRIIKPLC